MSQSVLYCHLTSLPLLPQGEGTTWWGEDGYCYFDSTDGWRYYWDDAGQQWAQYLWIGGEGGAGSAGAPPAEGAEAAAAAAAAEPAEATAAAEAEGATALVPTAEGSGAALDQQQWSHPGDESGAQADAGIAPGFGLSPVEGAAAPVGLQQPTAALEVAGQDAAAAAGWQPEQQQPEEQQPEEQQPQQQPAVFLPSAAGGAEALKPAVFQPTGPAWAAAAAEQPAEQPQRPAVFQPSPATSLQSQPLNPAVFQPAAAAWAAPAAPEPQPPQQPPGWAPAVFQPSSGAAAGYGPYGTTAGPAAASFGYGGYDAAAPAAAAVDYNDPARTPWRPPCCFGKLAFGGRLLFVSPSGTVGAPIRCYARCAL